MDYSYAVSTPKSTAKADAVKTELELSVGTISRVFMQHPEGCQGLAYASIWEGGHQLWPTNPDETYHGNDVPFDFPEEYELKGPAKLTLKTWNLDDTYAHLVFVRVTILRGRIDAATQALIDALNIIKQLLTGKRLG